MIALKKLYGDELLRLALVLSLLKIDPNDYLERETQLIAGLHISNGSDLSAEQEPRTLIRPRFVHPKSLDNILINYERELFEELNSLGRYSINRNNEPMWPVHTYLVNNVATDLVAPSLANRTDDDDQDGVSADDNVAQEVKVEDLDEESQEDPQESQTLEIQDQENPEQGSEHEEQSSVQKDQQVLDNKPETDTNSFTADAIVTLSADFFSNHTESDIFAEIQTRSFDVNEFLVQPDMQIKKEPQDPEVLDVNIKKERENDDLYSDNAMDDFVPYFTAKADKIEVGENSVFQQNMVDLQQYEDLYEDVKDLRNLEFLDVKQQQENLEQYLLENTPLDTEVYELGPIFEDELVLDVKRERASTSFTSASSSGVSEMEIDLKTEPDDHHTGDELTQEVSENLFTVHFIINQPIFTDRTNIKEFCESEPCRTVFVAFLKRSVCLCCGSLL